MKNSSIDSLRGKTILLVSTGSIKKKFILERMQELGLRIIALDETIAPWAKPYLAGSITFTHGTPITEVVQQAAAACTSYGVRGAITFWEEEVPLLAHLCEACGFIGNSVETALNTRSKFSMHEMLRTNNQPHIPQKLLRSQHDLATAMQDIGFPAVIKPLFGSDSQSVIRVDNTAEAEKAYRYVLESFQSPYEKLYTYERGSCVYQAYIDGKEFSVECACQNGKVLVLGIQEKTPMSPPFFMETGDIAPPRISDQEQALLESCAVEGSKALDVCNSLAHVEIKLTERGPQIIEVASRMGGDYISAMTHLAYGADLIQAGCEIALGLPLSIQSKQTGKCALSRYWIPDHSGIIKQFHTANLASLLGVECIDVTKCIGDTIDVPPDGYESAGWALVSGKTYEETALRMEKVMMTAGLRMQPK